jgi:SAM-dependent methyltransferase
VRAVVTNQLARHAPAVYVRVTGQTGRGAAAEEGATDIAQYFRSSVDAYADRVGIERADFSSYLNDKIVMEYGPGDLPGVAALLVGRGARKVYCVDRFPLVSLSVKNSRVLADLIAGEPEPARSRVKACLRDPSHPSAGFDASSIEYLVRPSGLSQLEGVVDLVISRAVLEHVNDLEATFRDMVRAMRPGAVAIHLVDLRSHGLHVDNALDFLTWSKWLWDRMYSDKGVPNRWRIDRYRDIVARLPVDLIVLEPTRLASPDDVRSVRPRLAVPFRNVGDEDLRCLGFWMVFRKRQLA